MAENGARATLAARSRYPSRRRRYWRECLTKDVQANASIARYGTARLEPTMAWPLPGSIAERAIDQGDGAASCGNGDDDSHGRGYEPPAQTGEFSTPALTPL